MSKIGNVAFEYRWAEGRYERLPALANDLVGRKVDVIVTGGGSHAAHAAKRATSSIPIVFVGGGDRSQMASSQAWPGRVATSRASTISSPS